MERLVCRVVFIVALLTLSAPVQASVIGMMAMAKASEHDQKINNLKAKIEKIEKKIQEIDEKLDRLLRRIEESK